MQHLPRLKGMNYFTHFWFARRQNFGEDDSCCFYFARAVFDASGSNSLNSMRAT